MSAVDEILAQVPMSTLAAQLGVDEQTAEQAVRTAIPSLLGGLQANATDPAGAASLAGALGQHSPDLLTGGVDLDQIDAADGGRIVQNVFGDNTDQVIHALGGTRAGGGSSLIAKLLPILAPIVLSYIAQQLSQRAGGSPQTQSPNQAQSQNQPAGADVLQDILGQVLGGGSAGRPSTQAGSVDVGSILGDVLGGLLGGGRR